MKSITFDSILATTGGYLSDRLYHLKSLDKREFQLVEPHSARRLFWLIIGREHYFETTREYAIANRRELKKALGFDHSQVPFPGTKINWIEPIEEQRFRVTTWVIRPDVLSALPMRPWILLPESLVLAQAITTGTARIERSGATLFVTGLQNGIASGLASSHIPTLEAFAYRVGATLDANNVTNVSDEAHFSHLLSVGLFKCRGSQLGSCFLGPERRTFANYPWRRAGILSSVVFAAYLALSSAWLLLQEWRLDQGLAGQGGDVKHALTQQQNYLDLQQQIATLSKPLQAGKPYWQIWPVVLELLKSKAQLSGIEYKSGEVTIRGTAEKTTELLSRLNELPNVFSPGLAAPITSNQGREDFAIRFYLEAQRGDKSESHQ
jgi:hypothetical protein